MHRIYYPSITKVYTQATNASLDQYAEKLTQTDFIDYFIPTYQLEGFSTTSTPKAAKCASAGKNQNETTFTCSAN